MSFTKDHIGMSIILLLKNQLLIADYTIRKQFFEGYKASKRHQDTTKAKR